MKRTKRFFWVFYVQFLWIGMHDVLLKQISIFHILNPFPIPRPKRTDPLWKRTVALAGRLASSDNCFAEWAEAVRVKCGPLKPDEKEDMIHELDAVAAHLYGLEEGHLRHIFETFHEGWDYASRLEAVLKHYNSLKKKL